MFGEGILVLPNLNFSFFWANNFKK
jgi:hypothetical protein